MKPEIYIQRSSKRFRGNPTKRYVMQAYGTPLRKIENGAPLKHVVIKRSQKEWEELIKQAKNNKPLSVLENLNV